VDSAFEAAGSCANAAVATMVKSTSLMEAEFVRPRFYTWDPISLRLFRPSPCRCWRKAILRVLPSKRNLALRNNIPRAAAKVPESYYGFRPTDEVRSFGQLVGHVAGAFPFPHCGEQASTGRPRLTLAFRFVT
jgi:hypothetical protein